MNNQHDVMGLTPNIFNTKSKQKNHIILNLFLTTRNISYAIYEPNISNLLPIKNKQTPKTKKKKE